MKEKIPNPNKMKRFKGPKISKDELKAAKVRITTYIDEDVIDALKKAADSSGIKYQTLLNRLLRQAITGNSSTILERLEKLEQIVLKKKAA